MLRRKRIQQAYPQREGRGMSTEEAARGPLTREWLVLVCSSRARGSEWGASKLESVRGETALPTTAALVVNEDLSHLHSAACGFRVTNFTVLVLLNACNGFCAAPLPHPTLPQSLPCGCGCHRLVAV